MAVEAEKHRSKQISRVVGALYGGWAKTYNLSVDGDSSSEEKILPELFSSRKECTLCLPSYIRIW